ncbi:hypothetical protein Nepgr_002342 [Nepenthes gracilis]|uniref:ATP-dependent helicase BRM n=1 Tax=Nepenthes gracilis TaxID=150966 RepID=A0AAD3P8P0_NEPGR|nr:hypothetical protein Nepgr_002342 [Nepenthes gracilis]
MQAGGGGTQQGLGAAGHGRSPTSAAASPSSSSSAVSAPHFGFDSIQQHQQQQQLGARQHQLLRKPEGNEAILAFQAGGLPGVIGGANFPSSSGSIQLSQQQRKFIDFAQQHGSPHMREDGQLKSQGHEQQVLNPVHQAYLQYALHAAQQKTALGMQPQQQAKLATVGPPGKDQDIRLSNLKMQDAISMQSANQVQASSSRRSSEPFSSVVKQTELGQQSTPEQRNEPKLPMQQTAVGQTAAVNVMRTAQMPQVHQGTPNIGNNQMAMAAQLQAVQAWALERNIDLSQPDNANLMAQLLMQSRMMVQQKTNEGNSQPSPVPMQRQQVASPSVASESSPHANSSSEVSGQSSSAKARQAAPPSPFATTSNTATVNNPSNMSMQQRSIHGRENQGPSVLPTALGNGMPSIQTPRPPVNLNQGADHSSNVKNTLTGPEMLQMQYLRQLNRSSSQPASTSSDGSLEKQLASQTGSGPQSLQHQLGFTKQQLHVLKAQILAFRRLKKGEGTLPQELLRAIAPPPLDALLQQSGVPSGVINQDRSADRSAGDDVRPIEANQKDFQALPPSTGQNLPREETFAGDEKASSSMAHMIGGTALTRETSSVVSSGKEEQQATALPVKPEQEAEHDIRKTVSRNDLTVDRGKAVAPQATASDTSTAQLKKPPQAGTASQPKDIGSARKYHGPLFDFPFFTRKHDSLGAAMIANNNNNLTLSYDIKDLLVEEGMEVLNKKRAENLEKIGCLLAVNLERKRIRPDLVLRLQIEEKKLKLKNLQARLRDKVDQEQQEIMAMTDREYRKFVKTCERQRLELSRQVQASQKAMREKQLKSIFQWRKKLLETHWAIRDARTTRNRGVAKYHERMLREFSKRKDDDRNKRMEALKNNDVERYREMLLEQQTSMPGDSGERYAVLSSFLTQTEEYLHKLGGKITAAKNQQEVEEAATAAAAAARVQGLSEDEVKAAAACAGEEVMIRNQFSEMNAPKDGSSASKYYHLAHAVNERVLRQPSMLRAGTLRDYQLVGLQWMLSLYNNKLNGILADEMGLGKTVQVMALIAYLMEFKGNYGPHLIIVPNAVLVNWKSEFHNWLPNVSCIFYVGGKDQRSKLFSHEVCAMKFNVLVTTYEFIMYDRSKLSKLDWKYIIIDEAQRMKDRESVLARDLDRYRCQRRLLLTGTPLQNDLKELWSLLNLLLPEVFDNRKAFHDWFSQPFQKEGPAHNAEDDWLETEKKVIIIHRLHQILEPFMLRRRVEDVEGSLPPKVSVVLKCRMSALQGAIYDWVKSTGTIRVDPEEEMLRMQRNPLYQAKTYRTLNNRCMELRKICNHPLLSYPYFSDLSKDFLVRSCGKLWILDRVLLKLHRTGHRVLLFSTMTKLLDIIEEYLQWKRLVYRRIDGTTSLEDRESAIVDFNSPESDCFIFLLSIRAAGRGLNLQSADTVVIYDPDPNPKNEEQAVARAHRIGQTREVKVIYMEAVVDKISSQQKEDEFRSGGTVDLEDDLAGKDRYMGSIDSLIRNNIQQYKIDMADEVINAGRFDQRTTHEERRLTLETLLHDEERYQETVHDVPSLQVVNRMIARSEEEVEMFDQMDEELEWTEEMMRYDQVPQWLRATTKEVNATIAALSKKPPKDIFSSTTAMESGETERKRGRRPRGKNCPVYTELDDENGESSEASSEERNGYLAHGEEGEIAEFEDEEEDGVPEVNKEQSEEGGPLCDDGYEYPRTSGSTRNSHMLEEAGSLGSSSDGRRMTLTVSPSISSQKFTTLSALDARPSSLSKKLPDELEEGEIVVSGDSHMDRQQSGSWNYEREEGEDEQVVQPKIKRKRSIRLRPRFRVERQEDRYSNAKPSLHQGDSSQFRFLGGQKFEASARTEPEPKIFGESASFKQDPNELSSRTRRNLPSRRVGNTSKLHASPKSSRINSLSAPSEEADDNSRGSWEGKVMNVGGSSNHRSKMTDIIQRRCKNVISKLQRRIDKEGQQITPLLMNLWRRVENSGYMSVPGNHLLDLRRIDQRIDRLEYNGVMELVCDVQLMLKTAVQFYGFSPEVRSEAKKVHDLFFDILKIAFPDTDFREARNAISFSGPAASSTPTSAASLRSAAVGQSKRHKLMNEVERDTSQSPRPPLRGPFSTNEETRSRAHLSTKESRLGSNGSSREQDDEYQMLTHPGELVVCKKRRKDREKSVVKQRTGPSGPTSPPSIPRTIRSPGSFSAPKETRVAQQGRAQQAAQPGTGGGSGSGSGGGGTVGWANPVKRLRTDAGKRRPSHL